MKKLFVFLLVEVLALSSGLFFSSNSLCQTPRKENSHLYNDNKVPGQPLARLDLYTIRDGALIKRSVQADDIGKGGIVVDGYVCGLVLFCNPATNATVDGKPMVRTDEKKVGAKEAYRYFPDVEGNAVSQNDEFRITVQSGDKVLDIPVQQKGSQTLATAGFEKDLKYKMAFHYLGSEPNLCESESFENRLRAVAQGIDAVQRTFGIPLVQNVNIIDYGAIQNAVMREGQSTIWFYTRALRSEALDELRVMAEHETLHLLVCKNRLTKNSQIRALFADLKGFGTFSLERFLLMTKGVAVSSRDEGVDREGVFFSFIDEKHFISGMHGGHSQENLDEFCTSFLHSLMYVDRFGRNLQTFLFQERDGEPSHLSPADRNLILHTYSKAIQIFSKAFTPPVPSSSWACSNAARSVLEKGLAEIRKEISPS